MNLTSQRWTVTAWLAVLFVVCVLCATAASWGTIGRAPLAFALIHLGLLAGSVLLVALYPFKGRTMWIIMTAAFVCRLAVMPMEPSDDVYRYAWEGRVAAVGLNPYVYEPLSEQLAHLHGNAWSRINHPDKTAIYPPGTMLLFRTLTHVSDAPWFFNAVFLAFDMVAVALIILLLRERKRDEKWALLYAVNPVILLAFAGEAHLDVLMVAAMMAALLAFHRRHWRLMFLSLAAAIHVKYVAVLMIPFLLRRQNLRHMWIFFVALLAPFLAFAPIGSVFTTLHTFSTDFHFNGSIHYVLGRAVGSFEIASWTCAMLLAGGVVLIRMATPRPLNGTALAFGLLLLLMPTVHFWYLAWLVPFLCFYPSIGGIAFTGAIALTFASQGHAWDTGSWHEFHGLVFAEYLVVAGALLIDLLRSKQKGQHGSLRTVSVIVPTLNEAATLDAFFKNLKAMHTQATEVVVADGGSTDGTLDMAVQHGAKVVSTDPGRGLQIHQAAQVARGDIIFIAHADMTLEHNLFDRILESLNSRPSIGGAAGCTFASSSPVMVLVDRLNALRASLFGISFGDQGQFIRRDALPLLGGFPQLPLMEDVELSLRIKEHSQPLYLGGGIIASERRWVHSNKMAHAFLVISLVFRYLLARLVLGRKLDVSGYYANYYGAEQRTQIESGPCKETMIHATNV